MSKRADEIFLFDIYIAMLKIEHVVNQFKNSHELFYDFVSWDSVIREFEIIGEATNRLLKLHVLDDDSRVVVDFRNLLIHHYFGIDPDEVWNVVEDNIPQYKNVIVEKIKVIDDKLKSEMIDTLCVEFSYIDFVVENLEKLR
jgi:uncharacterized protein with HEPN domain